MDEPLPRVSERDVRALVGPVAFERGHAYLRRGAVHDARRRGPAVEARCEGSHGEAYPVRAEFDSRRISHVRCGCPVGEDGRCKHVAAVLTLLARAPAEFVAAPEPEAALAKLSRDELLGLVRRLARDADGAASALDGWLAPSSPPPDAHTTEAYARLAGAAWRSASDRDAAVAALGQVLRAGLARAGDDPIACATAYAGVGGAAIVRRGRGGDGALRALVEACLEGLGNALVHTTEVEARARWLRELWDWYRLELEAGSRDVGPRVSARLRATARPDELARVARRVRAWMQRAEPWARRYLAGVWLDVAGASADETPDEEYLSLCRGAGRRVEAAVRRWVRGGEAAALEELSTAGEGELLAAADALEAANHPLGWALAGEVERRARTAPLPRSCAWLLARARRRGDDEAALRHAMQLLEAAADRDAYDAACLLGETCGRAECARDAARSVLRARHPALLVDVLLDAGEVGEAARLALEDSVRGATGQQARLRAAAAAERELPALAAGIYLRCAEALIRARGRENYRAAVEFIARARALGARATAAERAGVEDEIAALGARYAGLPALQAEMAQRRAGAA